ncbi:MAG TPA: fibronectin type III domain-containing protein, partial [Chitinophagaceae bacterium]
FTTTGSTVCSAPANLTTSSITETAASLSWSVVQGAISYTVQYRPSASSTWTSVNTESTSQTISGLSPSTAYTWQVKADCSSYSSTASFSTTGTTSCVSPTSLVSTNITSNSATLSWSAVAGATGYTLQYRSTATTTWSSVSTTATTVIISSLSPYTSYTWQVKADCSPYATAVSFTTSPSAESCSKPTNLSESNIASSSATLNWSAVTNAQNYSVRIREAGGKRWTNYNNIRTNYVNITRLKPNRSYEWILQTHCNDGSVSGFTSGKTFNTQ